MKAIIVNGPGALRLGDLPELSRVEPYQALVRIVYCGVCTGTDRKLICGTFPTVAPPYILGHEAVGQVVRVGADVKAYREGDWVLRPTIAYPGTSYHGIRSGFGGMAEYGIATDTNALPNGHPQHRWYPWQAVLPPGVDPILGPELIAASETLSWIESIPSVAGSGHVVVVGTGRVGRKLAFWAKTLGASRVTLVGRKERELGLFRSDLVDEYIPTMGKSILETVGPHVANTLIDASGDSQVLYEGPALLKEHGVFAPYGISEKDLKFHWRFGDHPAKWQVYIHPPEEHLALETVLQYHMGKVAEWAGSSRLMDPADFVSWTNTGAWDQPTVIVRMKE